MSARTKPSPMPALEERQKPGLSETLPGPRDPRHCQSCGTANNAGNELSRWIEHDEWDRQPTKPAVVVLCRRCAKRLIEPHPRLYKEMWSGEPFPGCMSICVGCTYRDGVSCSSPEAQINGGPGVEYTWDSPPMRTHLNYGGGRGEWRMMYSSPVRTCSGRLERAS